MNSNLIGSFFNILNFICCWRVIGPLENSNNIEERERPFTAIGNDGTLRFKLNKRHCYLEKKKYSKSKCLFFFFFHFQTRVGKYCLWKKKKKSFIRNYKFSRKIIFHLLNRKYWVFCHVAYDVLLTSKMNNS